MSDPDRLRRIHRILVDVFSAPFYLETCSHTAVVGVPADQVRLDLRIFTNDGFNRWLSERCANAAQAVAGELVSPEGPDPRGDPTVPVVRSRRDADPAPRSVSTRSGAGTRKRG